MRKIIAAINMTLDGFCDHTAGIPDEEIHQHYTDLLDNGGVILYGRITYQLMQFWQTLIKNPSGEKTMDDFAIAIDNIPKIVFSHTLKNTEWDSAKLANRTIKEEYLDYWKPSDYKQLNIDTKRAVEHYNNKRIHNNLDRIKPAAFGQDWKKQRKENRKTINIFNNETL